MAGAATLAALFEAHAGVTPRFKVVEKRKRVLPEAEGGGEGERASQGEEKGRDVPADSRRQKRTSSATDPRKSRRQKRASSATDPRESRTVFAGNLPISCSRKKLKQLFRRYGAVESVRLRSMNVEQGPGKLPRHVARRTQRQLAGSSLNAYVVFSSEAEARSALALSGTELEGRHMRVDMAARTTDRPHPHKRSVFVGNLPFDADEEAVRAAFANCGEVESVRVVRDGQIGIGKGFGFVLFRERSGVMFALKRKGEIELGGRVLRVFHSSEQEQSGATESGHRRQSGLPKFAGAQAAQPRIRPGSRPAPRRSKVRAASGKPSSGGGGLRGSGRGEGSEGRRRKERSWRDVKGSGRLASTTAQPMRWSSCHL